MGSRSLVHRPDVFFSVVSSSTPLRTGTAKRSWAAPEGPVSVTINCGSPVAGNLRRSAIRSSARGGPMFAEICWQVPAGMA